MSRRKIGVLLVEDNPGDVRLIHEMIQQQPAGEFHLTCVGRLGEALQELKESSPDVAMLDLALPDAKGVETVRTAHRAAPDIPLVVLTGSDDEAVAIEALHEGAQDYLVKGQIDAQVMVRALRYAIERQRLQSEIRNLSLFDDLTGLHNRRGFLALADQHLKLARRTGNSFLILFADLDGLKRINDTLGHSEGNRALVEVAGVLADSARHSDIVGRLGGDEFAVVKIAAGPESVEIVRQRILQKVEACNSQPGRCYRLSLSLGILPCPSFQATPLEELLQRADSLMYQEKRDKRLPYPQASPAGSPNSA